MNYLISGSGAKDKILVYIQTNREGVMPISLEVIGAASGLCETLGSKLCGVVVANAPNLDGLKGLGLDTVYVYDNESYRYFTADNFSEAVCDCANMISPSIFLLGATPEVRSFAPAVAAKLKTGITADCIELSISENGELIQTRPAFSGNIMASIITPVTRPQMATVRRRVMEIPVPKDDALPKIVYSHVKNIKTLIKPLDILTEPEISASPSDSRIVVAIGGGIKHKGDIMMFHSLSERWKATLACSRVLVERGWMSPQVQIGLSGNTIAAEFLFTFGVSGSVQFVSGIKRAKTVISINSDENAPVFAVSDYGFVCDMYSLIPLLLGK